MESGGCCRRLGCGRRAADRSPLKALAGENNPASKGLLDSLKALTGTLIAIVYTRLELLSTDLEEERERLAILLMRLDSRVWCALS